MLKDVAAAIEKVPVAVTRENLIERLYDRHRWPKFYPWGQPSVQVFQSNETILHSELFRDDGFLDSNKVVRLYQKGYTLLLLNIGRLFSDFAHIESVANSIAKQRVDINLYAGTGAKSISFAGHFHYYDVIVKNVNGTSEWLINEKVAHLDQQRTLLIPRYSRHQVTRIHADKMSLTCQLHKPV